MARLFYVLMSICLFAVYSHATVKVVIPSECKGKTHCDIKPPEYDQYQEKIDKHLGNGEIINYRYDDQSYEESIDEPNYDESENCKPEYQNITPYTIQISGKEEDRLVIAQSQSFKQRIRVTTCKNSGTEKTPCFGSVTQFQVDLEAYCVERTAEITLLVYDKGNDTIGPVTITAEVGCVCDVSYKKQNLAESIPPTDI